MRDFVVFGFSPYAAALLLVCVPAWRFFASPARRAALLAAPPVPAAGGAAWRLGLGLVLLGHAAAFLLPGTLTFWNRLPARLLILEASGFVLGVVALAGLAAAARAGWHRGSADRLADTLLVAFALVAVGSGLASAVLYRWGSDWYALALLPWFRSLLMLRPEVVRVAQLPGLVRLHVMAGIAAAAVLPFSHAAVAMAGPVVRAGRLAASLARTRPGRVAAVAAELAMVAVIGLLLTGALRRVGVSQGYAPAQPIAFSHKIHAGTYRVPCLYCHFAAEKSRHAGIPPEGVCMNCHRQLKVPSAEVERLKEAVAQSRPIRWTKIHNLPDFVYFSHSQHVTAGLACQRCHGPVETMDRVSQVSPLTMGWCLGCHKQEEVVPRSQRSAAARAAGHVATGGLECGKCHY